MPGARGDKKRKNMKSRNLKNMEWSILICVALLVVIGLVALYSATLGTGHEEFKKQVMWLAISIPFLVITMFLDYEILAKISPILYGISIILLIAVLFTEPISGASSWFVIKKTISFQPSEFAKVAVVLAYSYLVARLQTKGRDEISRPTRLFASLLAVAVPVLLIVKQPDYGTAMAFLFAIVAILFVAGIKKRYIFIALALVVIALPLLYFFVLPNHAKTRIDVFLNPEIDARGSGYNILQSKLAIGAGEMFGMGIGKGNQTQLGFLYPKTTDFIFSVIGEELGFVVGASVIALYILLITKAIYIAKTAKDDLGSYIAAGIAGIFIFHMMENIGMTMGLLPITGVPLPFVSYGGSSLVTNLILIGILLSVSGRRKKAIFME